MTAARNRTIAVRAAAFCECEWAFKRIKNGCGSDLRGWLGQLVAAMAAATRADQAALIQLFEQFAYRGGTQVSQFGQLGRRIQALVASGQAGQNHGGVIGELADAQHG